MNSPNLDNLPANFFQWLEALCEDRLSPEEARRLEETVLQDANARRVYLDYLDLHGTLHWNAAMGGGNSDGSPATWAHPQSSLVTAAGGTWLREDRLRLLLLAACLVLVAALSFSVGRWFVPDEPLNELAVEGVNPASNDHARGGGPQKTHDANRPPARIEDLQVNQPVMLTERSGSSDNPHSDLTVDAAQSQNITASDPRATANHSAAPTRSEEPTTDSRRLSGSVQGVVAVINEHLAAGWKLQGVEPSPLADDAEWLRRVYLDIVGHIPPLEVAEKFLNDRSADKREKLVESLLDDPAYVRNWSVIWTNLLIGRSDSRDVNRPALQKFLRESFARNRPWNQMVAEFISAEGRFDEAGATNFLLAHLNNQAVPATAITAKIFLGRQIGCTQCHDHPFNDWKQETFWSFNSFFQQIQVTRVERMNDAGKLSSAATALERKPVGGPTHFETRRGLMQVTYPRFEGVTVSDAPDVNRREELAKLMTTGDKTLVAEAFVNRMWEHFFGCGFTRPVDDMGPHNPPSHPELLDRLSREFVASGYDCKQLIRWICLSDAYQRSSRFSATNEQDDPAVGNTPLFSRVYVKSMTAEQLYDSLLLATGAANTPAANSNDDARRHAWLQQFVHAFQTDENDESMTFESSITQALLMMNSELIQRAVSLDRGSFLERLLRSPGSENEKLRQLSLATLTRYPTAKEQQAMRRLLREATSSRNAGTGWQDAMWAYLNSSEFILIH
jgi:hypothetical protein